MRWQGERPSGTGKAWSCSEGAADANHESVVFGTGYTGSAAEFARGGERSGYDFAEVAASGGDGSELGEAEGGLMKMLELR